MNGFYGVTFQPKAKNMKKLMIAALLAVISLTTVACAPVGYRERHDDQTYGGS